MNELNKTEKENNLLPKLSPPAIRSIPGTNTEELSEEELTCLSREGGVSPLSVGCHWSNPFAGDDGE